MGVIKMLSLDKVFSDSRDIVMGVELEGYFVIEDEENGEWYLNQSEEKLEDVLERLDYLVYRDYYPYQIEIRTEPSDEPQEVANQLVKLIAKTRKACSEVGGNFVPISKFKNAQYCGMHVHVTSPQLRTYESMAQFIYAIYPFMLEFYRQTASSPSIYYYDNFGQEIVGERLQACPHISFLDITYEPSYWIGTWTESNDRYYDIIINVNRREGRHRIKNIDTIEIRLFDSIGSKTYINDLLNTVYEIASRINVEYILGEYAKILTERAIALKFAVSKLRRLVSTAMDFINPLTLVDSYEVLRELGIVTSYRFERQKAWSNVFDRNRKTGEFKYNEICGIAFPIV